MSTITSTWLDHFERGVNVGGVTRSVVDYYSEVSYDAFTMQRQGNVAGPVKMPNTFDDYFKASGTGNDAVVHARRTATPCSPS